MFLNLEGFFYVLFSGSYLSAHTKQNLSIHSISENGRKPVKKISAYATALPALNVEVQSPYNRINISHNRKGHRAFAVFLSQPIYALSDFYYSPLTVDIGTYILMNATLKLLSFLIFGEICMVVSALVKNEVIPFCFSFTITLILVLCDAFIDNSTVSIFNPVTLLSCGKMFKEFQVIRIFDTPVYTINHAGVQLCGDIVIILVQGAAISHISSVQCVVLFKVIPPALLLISALLLTEIFFYRPLRIGKLTGFLISLIVFRIRCRQLITERRDPLFQIFYCRDTS